MDEEKEKNGEGWHDTALGNMEDMTRDSNCHSTQQKKEETKELWTLNVGGLQGLWRLVAVLEGLDYEHRPAVVHLQETSCESSQWISIEKYLKRIGYKAYHTEGTPESRPASGAWKRGIITMVAEHLQTRWLGGHSWRNGQYHALEIQGIMCINSYTVPTEDAILTQLSHLQGFMEQVQWEGRWVCGGDWNEATFDSHTAAFANLNGGTIQDCELISSTRWDSKYTIDFWFGNCSLGAAFCRLEKISDHKIVTTDVAFVNESDEKYTKFVQQRLFKCPSWISFKKWSELFNVAFEQGEREDWETARKMVEKLDWQIDADVQELINYQWAEVCSRLTWTLSKASSLALNFVPLEFEDVKEIQMVVSNANVSQIKGIKNRLQSRTLQKKAERSCEAMRKLYKKFGRLDELSRRLIRGDRDAETLNLIKKLFKKSLCSEIHLQEVTEELERIKKRIQHIEQKEKDHKLREWRKKMKTDPKAKGLWINKQGNTMSPMVQSETTAKTRTEGVGMIHEYWKSFWNNQQWEDEERYQRAEEVAEFVRSKTRGRALSGGRPSLKEFCNGLKRISGTHGIDGWASQELKLFSQSCKAAAMIWEAMELWEEENVIPECLLHCKLVCVPKKDLRFLAPNQYRPICVMSSLWRAWSCTWIRTGIVRDWTAMVFPKEVAGGIPNSLGAEVLASVVDHQLLVGKFGASLDFKHAFDTVDLRMMRSALAKAVPVQLQNWINLVFEHWCRMNRWIVNDGCVHAESICSATGLPQGDPAAPLVMNLLIAVCMEKVNVACEDPSLLNVTYMDDRTLVSNSRAKVDNAVEAWALQAEKYHLMENNQKAQFVQVRSGNSMEVLGAVVGKPNKTQVDASGSAKRLSKADEKYRRISFLPLNFPEKLKSANSYVKSGLDYGWLAVMPNGKQLKKQETVLWKCLGKTGYSSPHMRKVLMGAHSHLSLQILRRQIRIIAKRNLAMLAMGLEIKSSSIEKMVAQSLEALGWSEEGEIWSHYVYPDGFKINEMVDNARWTKVSHHLRESYRYEAFEQLKACGRHDALCVNGLAYDEKRRKLALKWAGANFTAIMLLLGGIQSPLQRHTCGWYRITLYCPTCGETAPDWEHLWRCFAGCVPTDGLLRRYIWPHSRADFPLCNAFLTGMQSF